MKKIIVTLIILMLALKTEAQSSVFTVVDKLLLSGNYQEALALLENQQPKTIEIYGKIASIYTSVGNYTKAIKNYTKALTIEENIRLKVKLGQVYNTAGLNSKAISIYEDIIEKDTSNLLVANSLGKLYLARNNPKQAEQLYRFLKRKDSLNPNYPFQLAEALSKQGKKLKMGQSYLDAYNLDTLHIKSIYKLARFFKTLRLRDSTMLFIDKGLAIDSTSINFLQLKANELYFSKEFKKAIKYLTKLSSLHFKSVNTFEMFGMCYLNLKEYDSVETYYRKALKLERNNPEILYRLGALYYKQEKIKLARLYLMQSIMFGKGDLDKQYFLSGVIDKEENKLKMAINYFDKAVKNNRNNYKALFQLALTSDIYYKDKKIAYKHYTRFVSQFESKDPEMTLYAITRQKEIKKQYFLEGEIVD